MRLATRPCGPLWLLLLLLGAALRATRAGAQSLQPGGSAAQQHAGARRLLATPPISVAGWPSSSTSTIASNLAALLVDTGKFTISSASYAGDKSCAGKAIFENYGKAAAFTPDHYLAYFLEPSTAPGVANGVSAVMLSTAKILGTSFKRDATLPLSTVKGASSTEIPGNVRSTKLTLTLTALANGYLRMPWTWSDAELYAQVERQGIGSDARDLMRILVNGVDRAVTTDNRFVRHSSFWEKVSGGWRLSLGDVDLVSRVMIDAAGNYQYPNLSIEFGGLGFMHTTKRVAVKKGQTITVTFMLGDMADVPGAPPNPQGPTVLYLKPKSITLSPVTTCSSTNPCSSTSHRCCGGFCCSKTVQCCSGECCASSTFTCIPFVLGGKSTCCPSSAACMVNGSSLCCPPGTRCVNGSSCQE